MILCLGEALVDLICERELDSPADADAFRPHFGGALANVAVAAAQSGAEVGLGGGVGADPWGEWLRQRLEREHVDCRWLAAVEGVATPIVFVTFDRRREPVYSVYGEGIAATFCSLEGELEQALDEASALVIGSNTLVGERERALTLRAWELAGERGLPRLFDPNLRAHRWRELDTVRSLCLQLAPEATVIRTNLDEGRWLAGLGPEADAIGSAEALAATGARLAVVTRGAQGAVVRGAAKADAEAVEVETVSPLGAGDAFMGALVAGLAALDFDLGRAAEVLRPACEAGARACTVWQAIP
jgi:fructokinase